jgi:hypothetical protein
MYHSQDLDHASIRTRLGRVVVLCMLMSGQIGRCNLIDGLGKLGCEYRNRSR